MNLYEPFIDAEKLAEEYSIKAASMRRFLTHTRYLLTIAIAGFGALAIFLMMRG